MKLTTILAALSILVVTPVQSRGLMGNPQDFRMVPMECATTLHWVKQIEKYGESLKYTGTTKDETVQFQLWFNEETGSWTTLYVLGPIACSVASGWNISPQ